MKKRRFKHLSWTDRLKIETMLKDKRHKQEIADEIGVHRKWPKRLTVNTWPQKVRT